MKSSKKGFALLITITLLAFLVLLLVSLASLTRVETQVADNTQKLSQARANALLALNLALGQLQKYAGPDQVVSARADITSAGALPQSYLTGLWKTTNTTSIPDIWLVSGNESSPLAKTPANVPDPSGGIEPVADGASGYVFLVGSNSVGSADLARRVRLDKQPIVAPAGTSPGLTAPAAIGSYAWWIGDEGIKASASLVNPLLTPSAIAYDNAAGSGGQGDNWAIETDKRDRLDQLQLTRTRLEHLFTSFNPDTDGLAGLPKVKNNSQLALMANPPTAAQVQAQFHSLTPLSRAVLVDLPTGRLKKDLSDVTASPDPAILSYQQTRLVPSTGFNAYYTPVAATNPAATSFPAYSLGPVLTDAGVHLNFYLSTTDNKVHCSYMIDAALWNPYVAELRLTGVPLTVEISGLPAVSIRTDGITNIPAYTPAVAPATVNPSVTWQAGLIRAFRGGTALNLVSTPGALIDTVVTDAPEDPTATTVTVTYPQVSTFTVVLKANGNVLATYTPTITFWTGSASNGTAAASTGWIMGYGYEFSDYLWVFTNGGYSTSFDPRLPVMNGNFNRLPSSTRWTQSVSSNSGLAPTSSTFGNGAVIALFDLPRQEITSLGMLTHVIGAAVFSRNLRRTRQFTQKHLEAGMVFVNAQVRSDPSLPFGGVKDSGLGRELGAFGIREFVNVKTICWA